MQRLSAGFLENTAARTGLIRWGALLLIGFCAATGWAQQPANDNFANATIIGGNTGSLSDSNVGATAQPGEPDDAGNPGGPYASVWYAWTAPAGRGNIEFDTEGSDFDTLMGVYIAGPTGPLSVSNLVSVAQNDDVSASDLTSKVTFNAQGGTTYYISVDGYIGDQGMIMLNWGTQNLLSAGVFEFASGTALPSYSIPPYISNSVPYSLMSGLEAFVNGGNASDIDMALNPPSATITRVGGSAGLVHVTWSVTNTVYTNILYPEVFGTNTAIVNGTTTNIYSTNYYWTNFVENLSSDGRFYYQLAALPATGSNITWESDNGGPPYIVSSTNWPNPNFPFPPPLDAPACNNSVTVSGTSPTNMTTTTIFCTQLPFTNVIVASAGPGDYVQTSGTVDFIDYQMSANIALPGVGLGNNLFVATNNALLVVHIDSVQLDPGDDTVSIAPPTVDPANGTEVVNVLNMALPGWGDSNTTNVFVMTAVATNILNYENVPLASADAVVNFEKVVEANWEANGPFLNGPPFLAKVARVHLIRTGTNAGASPSVTLETSWLPPNHARQNDLFPLQPGSDYATVDASTPPSSQPDDFVYTNGTVSWPGNNFDVMPFDIIITNDGIVEFNEDIGINIRTPSGGSMGQVTNLALTILFNDSPAGAVDRTHNMAGVFNTTPPFIALPGANATVSAVVLQPNGQPIIGGQFSAYNATTRIGIARLALDGSLDNSFLVPPNTGLDSQKQIQNGESVSCLALQPDGGVLVGGFFSTFNGVGRHGIARLNSDGSLDTTFNPGLGVAGPGGVLGSVQAVAVQPDGNVLIAGNFTAVNATNRAYIARLLTNGMLDATFDPGTGPNASINAIALQPNGQIVIGGNFTSVDGVTLNSIARLNSDGSLDSSGFNPGTGADGPVFALALQADGRILMGGAFHTFDLNSYNNLLSLNPNGSIDLTFNPGTGPDGTVRSIQIDPSENVLIGGNFGAVNGTRRSSAARLLPSGWVDTSWLDVAYNQFAGLVKIRHNDPNGVVYSMAIQGDGNVMIGGTFSRVGGDPFALALGTNYGGANPYARDDIAPRWNVARLLGGSTPGPGNVGLAQTSSSTDLSDHSYFVQLNRQNGSLGPAIATFSGVPLTPGPGAAIQGQDYFAPAQTVEWPTAYPGLTWMTSPAYTGLNNDATFINFPNGLNFATVNFPIVLVSGQDEGGGNLTLNLSVSSPANSDFFFLGGENIPMGLALGTTTAPLSLLDPFVPAGSLEFASPVYTVNENAGNALINVARIGGSEGTVSIMYKTVKPLGATVPTPLPGSTNAFPPADYSVTSGVLSFGPGVTNMTFNVSISNQTSYAQDKTVYLQLFGIGSPGTYGPLTNAELRIINDNFAAGELSFSSTNFGVNETAGPATISVTRTGGSSGTVSLTYWVTNGTPGGATVAATNGVNFTASTNTLSWASGDTATKTFNVPVFHDGLVTSNLTVNLVLTNAMVGNTLSNLALFRSAIRTAVLTITNQDFYGSPSFSSGFYTVNENGGAANITVVRQGGSAQTMTVGFTTSDGTALAGTDYTSTNGTLIFGPGVFVQTFTVPITFIGQPKTPDPVLFLRLQNVTPGGVPFGVTATAQLTIINSESHNEPPGGLDVTFNSGTAFDNTVYTLALQTNGQILAGGDFSVANSVTRNRIARLNADGSLDAKFSSVAGGSTGGSVRSLVPQTDGRVLVGGLFTGFNGVPNLPYITRLNFDGSLDSTFSTGSGPDGAVYAVAETFVASGSNLVRKIVAGGAFTAISQFPSFNVARLNNDGSLDPIFTPGGCNGTVFAVAVYPATDQLNAGKILIGGDFTAINGVPRAHIARLNVDGSLDASFNAGVGPGDSVRAIAIQVDGNVLIGGLFTSVSGASLNHIARLLPGGGVDRSFTPGTGVNDIVNCIALQNDERILLGGGFTQENGVTRNRITRLNPDGTIDPAINFGLGANDFVAALALRPDGEILIGGGFTTFDGSSRPYIALLYGGSAQGQGAFTFTAGDYPVAENATNALIGIRRTGGTGFAQDGNVSVTFQTSDGTAVSGVDYTGVTNTLTFPVGEVYETVTVPVTNTFIVESNKIANLSLLNPTNLTAGAPQPVLGLQPTATLTILNVNSAVSFSGSTYRVPKNVANGTAIITVVRNASSIGPASLLFSTTTNGTAQPGLDFTPTTNVVNFADGDTSETVFVPINNNGLVEGDRTVDMVLSSPSNTILLAPSEATLTIVDNTLAPGSLAFAQPGGYTIIETGGAATIGVIRTNGSVGQISVQYSASGGTATPFLDYTPTTNSLVFADGQTSNFFQVPVFHDPRVTGDQTVNLTLFNPTGNAGLFGPGTVPLTIQDADVGVGFPSTNDNYFVNETSGSVSIQVARVGNPNSSFTVQYATADGTATAGTNYVATSGTLTFNTNELVKNFNVPILYDPQVTGNLNFFVNLSNAAAPASLVSPTTATVTVIDVNAGLSFAAAAESVLKTGTNAIISVLRSGSTVGTVSVNFATANGSAAAGINYSSTNGTLLFLDGQASNIFTVPIKNDNRVDGDLTVNLALSGPSSLTTQVQLVPPSNSVLTIVETLSGFSFSSPSYTVNENGVHANVTVNRNGILTNLATVNFATSNGTAIAGTHYTATNGTLTFSNGVTSQGFTVPIHDNGVTGGTETVLLSLASPSTNAVLANPSAATLTILNNDGSDIVPAGAALLNPAGGTINPGATVTVLFAFRDAFGQNTTNLVATLLATNGVTAPSGPQTYGVLVADGPSVSRAFSFTASGTNGQAISAVFRLQDGAGTPSTNSFSFTLGALTNHFAVPGAIVINDNAPATPYPSTNSVSVNGTVSGVTVTVSNLAHGSFSDINMLLVGPTGTNVLLMGVVGGQHAGTNVTLTFDDAAAATLSQTTLPASGAYKPANYNLSGFSMFSPAPGASANAPYGSALGGFIGTNPNGNWYLYVEDDVVLDDGVINNGWILNITTLNSVPAAVDLAVGESVAPIPGIATSNLTYTITVTNFGPSTATGVQLTDTLPPGMAFVSASPAGSFTTNFNSVVFNLGSMPLVNGTNFSITNVTLTVAAATSGTFTNTVSVTGNEAEQNPDNNSFSLPTVVNDIEADMAVGVSVLPNPVYLGANVTYSLSVTNLGPATATNVVVSNTLPAGLQFVSALPAHTVNGATVSWSLGTMVSGATTNTSLVAATTAAGTITNTVGVGSGVLDPFKGNNQASTKVVVNGLQLGFARSGGNLQLGWPLGFDLWYATNLSSPVNWIKLASSAGSGTNTLTVPSAPGTRFFRLKTTGP